jgi:hypothetical protein
MACSQAEMLNPWTRAMMNLLRAYAAPFALLEPAADGATRNSNFHFPLPSRGSADPTFPGPRAVRRNHLIAPGSSSPPAPQAAILPRPHPPIEAPAKAIRNCCSGKRRREIHHPVQA